MVRSCKLFRLGARHGVKGIRRLYSANACASAESVFDRRSVCAKRWTNFGFSTETSMPSARSSAIARSSE